MRDKGRLLRNALITVLFLLLSGICATAQTQNRMTIQATAMGTSTQLGQVYDVNIHIEQLSTPADQKALMDAFKSSGQQGLFNALQGMKPKGRVRFSSGGVGNDVKYIIELPSDKGRRFRLVTDRNMSFAELRNNGRSTQYSVGAIELTITPDGKGSGRVLPACKIKLNKQNQIEIETFRNPFNLSNFRVTND